MDVRRSLELELCGSYAANGDVGMGNVRAAHHASSRLDAVGDRHAGHLDGIEATVTGVGSWGNVPPSDKRRICGDDDPPAKPRAPGHEV